MAGGWQVRGRWVAGGWQVGGRCVCADAAGPLASRRAPPPTCVWGGGGGYWWVRAWLAWHIQVRSVCSKQARSRPEAVSQHPKTCHGTEPLRGGLPHTAADPNSPPVQRIPHKSVHVTRLVCHTNLDLQQRVGLGEGLLAVTFDACLPRAYHSTAYRSTVECRSQPNIVRLCGL